MSEPNYKGPVTELAIRRLHPDQDQATFESARDTFVAALRAQPGVGVDREFAAFVDFGTFASPDPAVFIGMAQYDDPAAFAAAVETLGSSAEAGALFTAFTPEAFTALRPLNPDDRYSLRDLAAGPGEVLEVAVRDISDYAGFEPAEYEAKRDAFLQALSSEPGVVAEYQWTSLLDPNVVVGMTVYENMDSFQAVASSGFVASTAYTEFLGGYPPRVGYATLDARQMRLMDKAEWSGFLREGTRTAKLAVNLPSGRPTVTPVWFLLEDDGLIRIETGRRSGKVRALEADPRACLVVDLEEPPYAFVRIDATAEIIDDARLARRVATDIGRRYMGEILAEVYGERNGGPGQVTIEFTPNRVTAVHEVSD